MKKILVNTEEWQTRVAVLDEGKLSDIYVEQYHQKILEKSFFKGQIGQVLPGMQSAFVNIGQEKDGFLHITEVDRNLALEKMTDCDFSEKEQGKKPSKQARTLEKIFSEGEFVLVQVIKEPLGGKGPKLSTCFTLPGKFLVLMPNIPQIGVSKKITQREERIRLKTSVSKLLPAGMGAIIRTNAEGRPIEELKRDLSFLIEIWRSIEKKYKKASVGECLHQDIPLVLRTMREHLDEKVEMVLCDEKNQVASIVKFIRHFMPERINAIKFYKENIPLFEKFNVERQIEQALERKVMLPAGGSIVIEQTESMAVVDVNTGKYIGSKSHEETILKINLEAAEEVVRQLRLRNIGGIIVIDFIDMSLEQNREKLFKSLERHLKEKDKLQSVILQISEFGLVQMTRKRTGKTLLQQMCIPCSHCSGSGVKKSVSTIACEVLRKIKEESIRQAGKDRVVVTVSEQLSEYLIRFLYEPILALEKGISHKVIIYQEADRSNEKYTLTWRMGDPTTSRS